MDEIRAEPRDRRQRRRGSLSLSLSPPSPLLYTSPPQARPICADRTCTGMPPRPYHGRGVVACRRTKMSAQNFGVDLGPINRPDRIADVLGLYQKSGHPAPPASPTRHGLANHRRTRSTSPSVSHHVGPLHEPDTVADNLGPHQKPAVWPTPLLSEVLESFQHLFHLFFLRYTILFLDRPERGYTHAPLGPWDPVYPGAGRHPVTSPC